MTRLIRILVLLAPCMAASGCTICCAPFDDDYGCYGGIFDRADRAHGRVGSKFAAAEGIVDAGEGEWIESISDNGSDEVPHVARREYNPDFDLD
ncbi:MAG: hypothetical protein FJ295_08145 [Planctomycetes bacterium]|nr:hypothetical protein [Planctomycetota bacterium]